MIKRALAVALVSLAVCLPLRAQVNFDSLAGNYASTYGTFSINSVPALTLLNGRRFPLSNAWPGMTAAEIMPMAFLHSVEVERPNASLRAGSDGPGGIVNLRTNRWQSGGEVGVFYGRSSGKYGREDFSTYITGGIGNDYFNLTVGAAYHESSGTYRHRR